jgi:hypothetical protein
MSFLRFIYCKASVQLLCFWLLEKLLRKSYIRLFYSLDFLKSINAIIGYIVITKNEIEKEKKEVLT